MRGSLAGPGSPVGVWCAPLNSDMGVLLLPADQGPQAMSLLQTGAQPRWVLFMVPDCLMSLASGYE